MNVTKLVRNLYTLFSFQQDMGYAELGGKAVANCQEFDKQSLGRLDVRRGLNTKIML